jgi:hypothetical protein
VFQYENSCPIYMFFIGSKYFYNHQDLFINSLFRKLSFSHATFKETFFSFVRNEFSFKIKVKNSFNKNLTFSLHSVHDVNKEKRETILQFSICLHVIFLKGGPLF